MVTGYGLGMQSIGELNVTRLGPCRCPEAHEFCAQALYVNAADPRIAVSDLLLHEMLVLGCGPNADLRPGPGATVPGKPLSLSPADLTAWFNRTAGNLEGWLLTVRGVNQTVVYRITGKAPDLYAWYAEWPD